MATTTSKDVLLWTLLGPVTIAGSLGTPVQTIAIKRFTTESNRWTFGAYSLLGNPMISWASLRGYTVAQSMICCSDSRPVPLCAPCAWQLAGR